MRQNEIILGDRNWKHDDLASDLAAHLRGNSERMVWEDMQLGPAGSPRPDVYTIPFSYSRFMPVAYECKISTADFRRDVTAGKWSSYLKFAAGVVFAVPAGLVAKEEIPTGCGLMVRSDAGWRTVKGPTLKAVDNLPRDAWMKIIIDGIERATQRGIESRQRSWRASLQGIERDLGKTVADAVRDRMWALESFKAKTDDLKNANRDADKLYRERMEDAKKRADQDIAQANEAMRDLAISLGLPAESSVYSITRRCRELATRLDESEEIRRLRKLVDQVHRSLEEARLSVKLPLTEIAA